MANMSSRRKFLNSQYECSQGNSEDVQSCQNLSSSPMPKYHLLVLAHIMKANYKVLTQCALIRACVLIMLNAVSLYFVHCILCI